MQSKKQNLLASFRDRCKQYGLNITPQRVAIYEKLVESKAHPNSDDIFEKVRKGYPNISLDTVYRTLSKFAEVGIIDLVEGYGESKRYDPDTSSHHHLRCRKCNKIVDFHNESFDKLKIPQSLRKKFKIANVKVVLEGVCKECSRKR